MKTVIYVHRILLSAAAFILVLTGILYAQELTGKQNFNENNIKTLIEGIQSQNEGVKKSCIVYAGLYNVEESADALIDELESEKNSEIRILITLSLYKIGTKKCLEAISNLPDSDPAANIGRLASSILNQLDLN